ncbi:MAG TPA: hypothetical protein PKG60_04955 [Spirochaetota bacterium]|nr:hypothetical protein [Spirochaetota bacterium]HPS86271.1 hypothetical protein [Spirochaetota bacterium]
MYIKKKLFLITLSLIFAASSLHAGHGKKLKIKGVRIFSENELYSQLQLNRFEEGKIPLAEVIISIKKFYRQKNYTLVQVYSTDVRTSNEFVLFVDEGRIGKIIVHNLNNYYSLKFKQQIKIPERVYNTDVIKHNLQNLKNKFPSSDIRLELQQPPDYEGNLIQLDRELQRLKLGEIIDIDFFERYTPLHDLHFYVTNKDDTDLFGIKAGGFGFDIDYKFPSVFAPVIYYYDKNVIASKDYFESSVSAGFDLGLKGLFNYPPENTVNFPPKRQFIELTGEYKISPMQNDIIGPLLRGRLYHSESSREDLGIKKYSNLKIKGTLAPEFTLLKNLNIYAGFGEEQVWIYGSDIDYEAEKHLDSSDDIYRSSFAEVRVKFDPVPIRIGNRIDKYIIFTYTDYLSANSSNELEIQGAYDAEFENLSILSLKAKGVMLYNKPPFYNNRSVESSYFKGFSGDGYYTNKEISVSTEYRFSIYQDFIYAGGFFDWVAFEPEGYILHGIKQGIVYGPTARFLIYDQFEFIIYFGFDRLFPDNERGNNLKMKLTKKW